MDGKKVTGIVLAIIGIILFIVGIVMFNSGEQQLARAFGYSGPETIAPILMMAGGGISLVIGAILVFLKRK
ncbi:MAG: DUF3185 family protein [Oscillospiraceae bacterium]|nr:DUF3185 family protein [Oscillospiraceae bacterium]